MSPYPGSKKRRQDDEELSGAESDKASDVATKRSIWATERVKGFMERCIIYVLGAAATSLAGMINGYFTARRNVAGTLSRTANKKIESASKAAEKAQAKMEAATRKEETLREKARLRQVKAEAEEAARKMKSDARSSRDPAGVEKDGDKK